MSPATLTQKWDESYGETMGWVRAWVAIFNGGPCCHIIYKFHVVL